MNYDGNLLPSACPSPRIVGGVLKWYEGDTFDLQVHMELQDEDGAPMDISSGDTVAFVFRDMRRRVRLDMLFEDIEDNTVVLRFTEPITALFPAGDYTYDVIYKGAVRRTLANDAPIRVE